MPLSAYFQSALFLIGAAVALFASAGTFAIASLWIYLAIWAAVFVASLALLDPGLLQERMRPGGWGPYSFRSPTSLPLPLGKGTSRYPLPQPIISTSSLPL